MKLLSEYLNIMQDFPTAESPIKSILNVWLQVVAISWKMPQANSRRSNQRRFIRPHNAQQPQDSRFKRGFKLRVSVNSHRCIQCHQKMAYQTLVMCIRRGVAERFEVCQSITFCECMSYGHMHCASAPHHVKNRKLHDSVAVAVIL